MVARKQTRRVAFAPVEKPFVIVNVWPFGREFNSLTPNFEDMAVSDVQILSEHASLDEARKECRRQNELFLTTNVTEHAWSMVWVKPLASVEG